jgi:hypothetical protein
LTLVDSYLLASMVYVLFVVISNAILVQTLATSIGDDDKDVLHTDWGSFGFSAVLWIAMHIYYNRYRVKVNKVKKSFLSLNGLEITENSSKKPLY